MEALNLYHLSLILDQDLIVIPEEIRIHQLSEKLKARHAYHPEEGISESNISVSEPPELNKPEKEYQDEFLKINYEGNFEKEVLIIYEGSLLEDSSRDFLMKILGAVGCSLKDVALVAATHLLELPSESISHLNPHKCIVFGKVIHPLIRLKKENYEIISGEIVFLFADDLKEIAENIPLKKKLWSSLQVLFTITK